MQSNYEQLDNNIQILDFYGGLDQKIYSDDIKKRVQTNTGQNESEIDFLDDLILDD